ncbi:hypothetical protein RIF29_38902 [Crotalaria pallida]|uniref:MULE transposase domain-containing protein n=1 Tax=Crotalaria pallida TaxID=3830 RepID=A0AAN9E055_CROPI
MITLQERYPGNVTTMKQIYNVRGRYKKEVRHSRTQMQHLLLCLAREGYQYAYRTLPDSDVVKDIFWAHPDSIALVRNFSLVLVMDNTYKTNRYRVPLLEIVGQTSTCKTFSAAFSFMSSENYDSFVWALKQFSALFSDPRQFPMLIVTDFDGALVRAIGDVFPTSTHHLCQFHVKCNVKGKFKIYFQDTAKTGKVMKAWMDVVHCKSIDEYEAYLNAFKSVCKEVGPGCGALLDYVERTYLNHNKEKFVDAWVNQHMHLGNTMTNRVESAHSTFKRMLADSFGDLATCFDAMHSMLICQHRDIVDSFQKSITRVDHVMNIPFYSELRYAVSREALIMIHREVQSIGGDGCVCRIRTTHGLPCCCELAGYKKIGQCIHLSAIHVHWKKLSMFDCGQVEPDKTEDNEEVDPDPLPLWEEYLQMFNAGDKATKKRLWHKFREVVRPETTTMIPPREKVNAKGRKAKKDKTTKRCPSQWELVDSQVDSLLKSTDKSETLKKKSKSKSMSKSKSKSEKCTTVPQSQACI